MDGNEREGVETAAAAAKGAVLGVDAEELAAEARKDRRQEAGGGEARIRDANHIKVAWAGAREVDNAEATRGPRDLSMHGHTDTGVT